ncbi:MAG: hypothetical protein NUV73_01405 [Candidatus Daviesbacteria bacterium]|nr:hypothetical protein [Candidatus Daviesbacteria bacterium]
MQEPAPKEIPGVPFVKESAKQPAEILEFIPHQEKTWSNNMGQAARQVDPSFKPGDEIPPTAQTIQNSNAGTHIQPGINAESPFDVKDMTDIAKKTTSHTINLVNPQEGLSAHVETASGSNIFSLLRKKIQRFKESKKAA